MQWLYLLTLTLTFYGMWRCWLFALITWHNNNMQMSLLHHQTKFTSHRSKRRSISSYLQLNPVCLAQVSSQLVVFQVAMFIDVDEIIFDDDNARSKHRQIPSYIFFAQKNQIAASTQLHTSPSFCTSRWKLPIMKNWNDDAALEYKCNLLRDVKSDIQSVVGGFLL